MTATSAFWDKIADKYAATPIKNQASYDYTLNRTKHYLGKDDTVLELGCGTGSTALELAGLVPHIAATDISAGMLQKAQTKLDASQISNVAFAQADTAGSPTGPFDVVMAFNLLHLVPDLDRALADIAKRVRPGGYFISKTFCMPERVNAMSLMITFALPLMQAFGKAPQLTKFKAAELDRAITRAGFSLIETGQGPTKDPRRFLVARRDG